MVIAGNDEKKTREKLALRIRWLKRARPPVLFALLGTAILAVPQTGLAPDWEKLGEWPNVVATICFIVPVDQPADRKAKLLDLLVNAAAELSDVQQAGSTAKASALP